MAPFGCAQVLARPDEIPDLGTDERDRWYAPVGQRDLEASDMVRVQVLDFIDDTGQRSLSQDFPLAGPSIGGTADANCELPPQMIRSDCHRG